MGTDNIVVEVFPAKGPVVVVHGGSFSKKAEIGEWGEKAASIAEKAAQKGMDSLLKTGDPVKAAVESVKVLEDTCILNAGRGSVMDASGRITMDAGLMRGWTLEFSSVANVTYPLHPIELAHRLLEKVGTLILAGPQADIIAAIEKLTPHPGPCQRAYERWRRVAEDRATRSTQKAYKILYPIGDTVGAVVSDGKKYAAAVSTGGILFKIPGRVGDSPLPGAGFYADGSGAVVATGIGETIARYLLSYKILKALPDSVEGVLADFTRMLGEDTAGVIFVGKEVAGYGYNSGGMPWAICTEENCLKGWK